MKKTLLIVLCVLAAAYLGFSQPGALSLRPLSTTDLEGGFDEGAAEISAYDPSTQRLYVVNAAMQRIDAFDISNPIVPELLFSIDVTAIGANANSIVVVDGYLVAAIEDDVKQNPGFVAFFDQEGFLLQILEVGALPDMIGLSHDGTKLITANEGEPSADYGLDPVGSVSIIDVSAGVINVTQNDVTTVTFENYNHIRGSFELNDNWVFESNISPYEMTGEYVWGPVASLAGRSAVHGETFWGMQQLNNVISEGAIHTLTYEFAELVNRPNGSLSFRYFTQGFETDDSFGVKIMTQANQDWEQLPLIALEYSGTGWMEFRQDVSENDGFIAVQFIANTNDIDDIAGLDWVHVDFLHADVRIFGNNRLQEVDQDLEPEYCAFNADDTKAVVTLQENNAVAIIDVVTGVVESIVPLGYKDHSLEANKLDPSNTDGGILIQNWPVFGMYQPDAISSFEVNGETYYITANEGDAREYDTYVEIARISSRNLDANVFPNGATLKQNANLGRLNITTSRGDIDFDGDFDELYAYGARSFSILNASGEMIFDSGDDLEQLTAQLLPTYFNSNNDDNTSFDSRSDDKGPEPEGTATGVINGRTYAFIGLERIGGIMVYDVTNPLAPEYITYANNRNWDAADDAPEALDMGPEGVMFIPAAVSPNERNLLVVSNEISGTVTIYQIDIDRTVTGEIGLTTHDLQSSELIGFAGLPIYEGGISGMFTVPGSSNEFYVIGDRGPNADANNSPLAQGETKVFVFPDYAPKMHRMVAENGTLNFVETLSIKQPNGNDLSGRPLPEGQGSTGEFGLDTEGNAVESDVWGLDSEGILLGNDGFFWICDEYGAAILKLNAEGRVINRYTPFPTQNEDVQIDPMVGNRKPNRGFEGIAWTPNGRIYAILQSPAENPDAATGNTSRLHSLMELDPLTGEWRTFFYAHKPAIGEIRERDWKIGDLVAINNSEFLLLEHAERNGWNYKNVVKIDISNATPVTEALVNGLTPEQFLTAEEAANNGIIVAQGELYLDLLEAGWDTTLDKPEGLSIIDANTIAVINDNDFGINSPNGDGQIEATGKATRLYIYTLPEEMALNYQSPFCAVEALSLAQCENALEDITAPEGYVMYEWSNGEMTQSISLQETAQLVARLTNEANCAAFLNVDFTVNPSPVAELLEPVVLCPNDYSVLELTGNYENILWSNGDMNDFTIIDPNNFPTGITELTVTYNNAFGCENSTATTVEVVAAPEAALLPYYEVCEGGSITLNAGSEEGQYVWSTGENTASIEVTEEGPYNVDIITAQGCIGAAATYVNYVSAPVVNAGLDQVICEGDVAVLSVGDYENVMWSTCETSNSIEVSETGIYTVTVMDNKGCEGSDEVQVEVEICVGVEELGGEIVIYPNPARESITIDLGSKASPVSIGLLDMRGRELERLVAVGGQVRISLENFSSGMYMIKISDAVGSKIYKIEKL